MKRSLPGAQAHEKAATAATSTPTRRTSTVNAKGTMVVIDGPTRDVQSGGVVARDPVEQAYTRCRRQFGALGVSQAAFRKEALDALDALDGSPITQLDNRLQCEDLYLALGCVLGSEAAWRHFDRAYRGYLLRLATRYCGGREAAEDLITDLFHDLVARPKKPGKLHQYRGYASLSTWLAVIVRRMAMDRGRSLERKGARMRRLRVEGEVTRPARNPERDFAAAQDAELTGRLFSEAMGQLEPRHLLVINLLYRDDLTLREAGRVMDLDFSTVSRRAKAARAALRATMTALAEDRWGLSEEAVARMFVDGAAGASFQGRRAEGGP